MFSVFSLVLALDDGLARTPPMGYRTWNDVHGIVDAAYVQKMVDAVVSRQRLVDGKPMSLLDLGYARVGLDDGWQACGTGYAPAGQKPSFHAADGTPLVNKTIFPSLKAMVTYGHSKGVLMDFYGLNCICMDEYTLQAEQSWGDTCYAGDVKLLLDAGFDGIKIDNCGDDQGRGYVARTAAINASASGKILIENSNQGFGNPWPDGIPSRNPPGPPRENPPNRSVLPNYCPFHMFRSGGDIGPSFGDIYGKLQFTRPYLDAVSPVSRPGCWAFPDMLEVGNFEGDKAFVESRSHFGAWCVISSPLLLSTALADNAVMDAIWPIVSNTDAIRINQMWHGHPGRFVTEGPGYQLWAKVGANGSQAVFLLNHGDAPLKAISVALADVGLSCSSSAPCAAYDVWARADLPEVGATWDVANLAPHDSQFVSISPPKRVELDPTLSPEISQTERVA